MALAVKELLALPSLRGFHLEAGNGGLNNTVTGAGIADYEFAEGLQYDLNKAFDRDSIVISSLLFAREKPQHILPAIQMLKKNGIAAFAYKRILFETLPQEVLCYAEENDFPIFSFSNDIWFENIIFDVMNAVETDDQRHLSEINIEKMIKAEASASEVTYIRQGISLLLNKTVSATYIKHPQMDASRVYRAYYMSKNLREKLLVAKYEDGIFLLITTAKWNESLHRIILKEACQTLSLPVSPETIILSKLHPAYELDQTFREAYYAWATGLILVRKGVAFDDLGVYTALLPLANSREMASFASCYMERLNGYEETIEAYVKNGGDVVATSVDLGCHANTVRYRLNRMKELVHAPNETDHELFRDLSIAYVIKKLLMQWR